MNTLICMGLLISACLAFAMALPMAPSEVPAEGVAEVPEGEMLQPAESYYGGYGRRYGGYYGHGYYGHGYGHRYGHGYGHGYGRRHYYWG